ncbi:TPA: hypothetical protein ACH7AQ_005111, partial [Escherichia coli]
HCSLSETNKNNSKKHLIGNNVTELALEMRFDKNRSNIPTLDIHPRINHSVLLISNKQCLYFNKSNYT